MLQHLYRAVGARLSDHLSPELTDAGMDNLLRWMLHIAGVCRLREQQRRGDVLLAQ